MASTLQTTIRGTGSHPSDMAPKGRAVSLLPLMTLMTSPLPSLIQELLFKTFILEFDLNPSCSLELGPWALLGGESV